MARNRNTRAPRSKRSSPYAHPSAKRARTKNRRTATPAQRAKKAKVFSAFADQLVGSAQPIGIPLTWKTSFVGVLLAPLVAITMLTFLRTLTQVTMNDEFWRTPQFFFFHLGIVLWLVVLVGLRGPRMIWWYVLGHEYTHAAAALCCGGKILGWPVVTSSGGQVLTNKNNVFISLAPYLVPFYSVIATAIYVSLHFFFKIEPIHERLFFGVIGFTLAFHLTFTFLMVTRSQPDLENYGVFFSLVFILLINILIISALFVTASPTVDWHGFGIEWWEVVCELSGKAWNGLAWFFGEISTAVNSTRN